MAEEFSEEISAEFLQNIQTAVDASGVIGRVEVIQTENGPMTVIFMDDSSDPNTAVVTTSDTVIDTGELQHVDNETILTEPESVVQCETSEVEVTSVSDILTSYISPPVDTTSQMEPEFSATPFIPQVSGISEDPPPSASVITENIVSSPLVSIQTESLQTDIIQTENIYTESIQTECIQTDGIQTDVIATGGIHTDSLAVNDCHVDQEEMFTATPLFQFASAATAQPKVALTSDVYHTKPALAPKVVTIRKPGGHVQMSGTDGLDNLTVGTQPLYKTNIVHNPNIVSASTMLSPVKQIIPKNKVVRYVMSKKQEMGLEQLQAIESIVPKEASSIETITIPSSSVNLSHPKQSHTIQQKPRPVTKTIAPAKNNPEKQRVVKRFLIPKYGGDNSKVVEMYTGRLESPPAQYGKRLKTPTVVKGLEKPKATSTQTVNKIIPTPQSVQKTVVSSQSPAPGKRLVELVNSLGEVNVVQLDSGTNFTYVDSSGKVLTPVEADNNDQFIPKVSSASTQVTSVPSTSLLSQKLQEDTPSKSVQNDNREKAHSVTGATTQTTTLAATQKNIPEPLPTESLTNSTAGLTSPSAPIKQKVQEPEQQPVSFQKDESVTKAAKQKPAKQAPKPASSKSKTTSASQTGQVAEDDGEILQTIEIPDSDVIVHIFKNGSLQTKDRSGRSYSKISLESLGVKPGTMSKGANIDLSIVQPDGREVRASIYLDLRALSASQQSNKPKPKPAIDNVKIPELTEISNEPEKGNPEFGIENSEKTLENDNEVPMDSQNSEQDDANKDKTKTVDRPYKCSMCPRTFKFEGTFTNHEAVHERDTYFTCLTCKRVFAKEENLKSHMKLHEQLAQNKNKPKEKRDVMKVLEEVSERGDLTYGESCEFCGWIQKTHKYTLLEHIDRLHNKMNIQCSKCKRVFSNKAIFTKHMFLHSAPYTCPYCFIKVGTSDEMIIHLKQNHPKLAIICEICDEILGSKGGYRHHVKAFHADAKGLKFTPREYKYKCKDCGDLFVIYSKLMLHKLQHTDGPEKCSYCSQRFGSVGILNKHVKQAHKSQYTKFSCDKCCMTFKRKDFFEIHKEKFHTGPYSCEECGLELAELKDLIAHRYTEHGVGIICKICGTKFERRVDLIKHKESEHRRPANYLCDLCGAGFVHKTYLKSHLIHEHFKGDRAEVFKAYPNLKSVAEKCELCKQVLKDQYESKLHYLDKHFNGDTEAMYKAYPFLKTFSEITELLKCDKCEKMFANMLTFQRHMVRHGEYLDLSDKNKAVTQEDSDHAREEKEASESEASMEVDLGDIVPRDGIQKTNQCNICKQKFARKSALKRHEEIHKTDDFLFALRKMEEEELKRMNEEKKGPASPKKDKKESSVEFQCKVCAMKFKRAIVLKRHLKESHGIRRGRPLTVKPIFTIVKKKTLSKGRGRPRKNIMISSTADSEEKKKGINLLEVKKKTEESLRGRGRPRKDKGDSVSDTPQSRDKSESLPKTPQSSKGRGKTPKHNNESLPDTPHSSRGRGKPPKEKSDMIENTPESNRGRGRPPKEKSEVFENTPKSSGGRGRPPKEKSEVMKDTPESKSGRGRPLKEKSEVIENTSETKAAKGRSSKRKSEMIIDTPESKPCRGRPPKEISDNNEEVPPKRRRQSKDDSEIIEKTQDSGKGRSRTPKEKNKTLYKTTSQKINQAKPKTTDSSKGKLKATPDTPDTPTKGKRPSKLRTGDKQKTPDTVKGRIRPSKDKAEIMEKTPGSGKGKLTKHLKEKSPEVMSAVEAKEMDIETFLGSNFSLGKKCLPKTLDNENESMDTQDKTDVVDVVGDANLEELREEKGKLTEGSNPESAYTCKICSSGYNTLNGIRKHLEIFHPMVRNTKDDQYVIFKDPIEVQKEEISYFPCQLCPKAFEKEANLKRHVTLKHFASTTFIKIKQVSKVKNEINKDINGKKRKREELSELAKAAFKCKKCPSTFKLKKYFQLHMEKKHGKASKKGNLPQTKIGKIVKPKSSSTFPCKSCNKTFTKATQLVVHVRVHHKSKPKEKAVGKCSLRCSVCKKQFSNDKLYKTHLRQNHKKIWERMQSLSKSQKELSKKEKLKRNAKEKANKIESHKNVQKVLKESKERKSKRRRVESEKTASPSKKALPTTSGTDVVGKAVLDVVENEYQCGYCSDCVTVFQSQDKLAAHLKLRHGIPLNMSTSLANCVLSFFCKQCHRVFWTEAAYTNHMKSVHPDRFAIELDSRVKEQMREQLQKPALLSPKTSRKSAHQGPTKIKCEFCKRVHWTRRRFEEHMIEEHYDEAIKDPGAYGLVLEQPGVSQRTGQTSSQSNTLRIRLGINSSMNMEQLSASSSVLLEKLPLERMINMNRDEIVIDSQSNGSVKIIEPLAVCSVGDEAIFVTKNEDFEPTNMDEQNNSNDKSLIGDQSVVNDEQPEIKVEGTDITDSNPNSSDFQGKIEPLENQAQIDTQQEGNIEQIENCENDTEDLQSPMQEVVNNGPGVYIDVDIDASVNTELQAEENSEVLGSASMELLADESTEVQVSASTELSAEEKTELLVNASTELLADESTEVQVSASMGLLANKNTEVPVIASTELSAEENTDVLVNASTQLLTDESTKVPVSASTELLADENVDVPVYASTKILGDKNLEVLVSVSTELSDDGNAEVPVYASKEIPADDNTEVPVTANTEVQVDENIEMPVSTSVEPAEESTKVLVGANTEPCVSDNTEFLINESNELPVSASTEFPVVGTELNGSDNTELPVETSTELYVGGSVDLPEGSSTELSVNTCLELSISASTDLPDLCNNFDSENTNNSDMVLAETNILPETILNGESETRYMVTEESDKDFAIDHAHFESEESSAVIEESDIEELAPLKDGNELMDTSIASSIKSQDEHVENNLDSFMDTTENGAIGC